MSEDDDDLEDNLAKIAFKNLNFIVIIKCNF